jgi:hypothetical protein
MGRLDIPGEEALRAEADCWAWAVGKPIQRVGCGSRKKIYNSTVNQSTCL